MRLSQITWPNTARRPGPQFATILTASQAAQSCKPIGPFVIAATKRPGAPAPNLTTLPPALSRPINSATAHAALRPLGGVRITDFGKDRGSDFGAAPGSLGVEFTITQEGKIKTPIPGAHLCFRARDRQAVDAFYAAALAGGGRDDGAPGLRPQYHADYYCAFVLDPDGHRMEAVCHAPASPSTVPVG